MTYDNLSELTMLSLNQIFQFLVTMIGVMISMFIVSILAMVLVTLAMNIKEYINHHFTYEVEDKDNTPKGR